LQELPARQAALATDAPDEQSSGLSQGAHGVHASDALHQLPTGGMAVAPADVARVASAQELLAAVKEGRRDIVLTEHLDLSTQEVDDLGFVLPLMPSTRSIQVLLAHQHHHAASLPLFDHSVLSRLV
jgi:hypothetical protein